MKWREPISYERYEQLKVSRADRIVRILISNPSARNAINADIHEELSYIFDDIDRDDGCDVAIVSGEGDAFCAGGDLQWLRSMANNMPDHVRCARNDRRIQNSMLDLEKPLIARVAGPAVGLGCSLALFCDFVLATPTARFADPHVSVGLVAGDGGALIWPHLVGYARAKRYVLTGDPISGLEAAEIGLITEVVDEAELDERVDALAERLTKGATQAIRWTKASMNAGLKQAANAVLDRAAGYELVSMHTQDHTSATDAFLNKQPAVFQGR